MSRKCLVLPTANGLRMIQKLSKMAQNLTKYSLYFGVANKESEQRQEDLLGQKDLILALFAPFCRFRAFSNLFWQKNSLNIPYAAPR